MVWQAIKLIEFKIINRDIDTEEFYFRQNMRPPWIISQVVSWYVLVII